MTTTPEPAWIAEGAEVAVISGGYYKQIEFVAITRIITTRITLADGRHFRRAAGYAEFGKGIGGVLADPRSPAVTALYARQMFRELARRTDRIVSGAGATIDKMDTAQIRDALDDLARQVDTARKEIDRRAGL